MNKDEDKKQSLLPPAPRPIALRRDPPADSQQRKRSSLEGVPSPFGYPIEIGSSFLPPPPARSSDQVPIPGMLPEGDDRRLLQSLGGPAPPLPANLLHAGEIVPSRAPAGLKCDEPKLENIVSTVNFDCELDLRKIALHARNAEYNPKRFAAVIMRIRDPKTTALIFRSGKMVCTGAKSEQDSETAARKYAKMIKKLGFNVKFKEFTIQNIVGSCNVKFAINLETLQVDHQKFCTYDPEIFPGLIYRMEKPRIVLLIFCSGKVVLTGAKKREQLSEAFNKIHPVLKRCQKKDTVLKP